MKSSFLSALLGIGFVASILPAHAQLVEYTFTGSFPTPSTTTSGFTASDLTASPGVAVGYNSNAPTNNPGANATVPVINVTGFGTEISDSVYFGFTLQNNSGASVDLTKIDFDFAPGGITGPRGFELRYSLDGFATSEIAGNYSGTTAVVWEHFSYNLVGDLTDGSTVEFRFLGAANAIGNGIRFDNIVVNPVSGGSAYDTWATGFPGFTPADATLDFDNDGVTNLLEFVFGGDPRVNDSPPIRPTVVASDTELVVTFYRSTVSKAQPVAVKVQVSTDLVTWDPADEIFIGDSDGSGPNEATYSVEEAEDADMIVVSIPNESAARKFVRVVATD